MLSWYPPMRSSCRAVLSCAAPIASSAAFVGCLGEHGLRRHHARDCRDRHILVGTDVHCPADPRRGESCPFSYFARAFGIGSGVWIYRGGAQRLETHRVAPTMQRLRCAFTDHVRSRPIRKAAFSGCRRCVRRSRRPSQPPARAGRARGLVGQSRAGRPRRRTTGSASRTAGARPDLRPCCATGPAGVGTGRSRDRISPACTRVPGGRPRPRGAPAGHPAKA